MTIRSFEILLLWLNDEPDREEERGCSLEERNKVGCYQIGWRDCWITEQEIVHCQRHNKDSQTKGSMMLFERSSRVKDPLPESRVHLEKGSYPVSARHQQVGQISERILQDVYEACNYSRLLVHLDWWMHRLCLKLELVHLGKEALWIENC